MTPSVTEFFHSVRQRLSSIMGATEAEAAARIIFEDVAGYNRNFLWTNGDRSMVPETAQSIDAVVSKIESGMPVQYAVGKALFMGNYFKVNRSTLIPRPETAGLVDLVTDRLGGRSDLRVLDVGTGSGCIAIELAKALPFSKVEGWDISEEALTIARENAKALKVNVTFRIQDVLAANLPKSDWDVIVSNPPYVRMSERSSMEAHVLDFEPETALFVPDSDPLVFYRAIAAYAKESLVSGGMVFFEINEALPVEVKNLLESDGFADVECLRDFRGAWRYAIAKKS